MDTATQETTTTLGTRGRRASAHRPEHARYAGVLRTGQGKRYEFRCPTSAGDGLHRMFCGPAGERPCCTCKGYHFDHECALTKAAPDLMRGFYAARAARLSDTRLLVLDHDMAGDLYRGTLSAGDRLAYDSLCDEIAARFIARWGRVGEEGVA